MKNSVRPVAFGVKKVNHRNFKKNIENRQFSIY